MVHLKLGQMIGHNAGSGVPKQVWMASFGDSRFLTRIFNDFSECSILHALTIISGSDVDPDSRFWIVSAGMIVKPRSKQRSFFDDPDATTPCFACDTQHSSVVIKGNILDG